MRGRTSCLSCQLLWGGWRSCGSCCSMTTGATTECLSCVLNFPDRLSTTVTLVVSLGRG